MIRRIISFSLWAITAVSMVFALADCTSRKQVDQIASETVSDKVIIKATEGGLREAFRLNGIWDCEVTPDSVLALPSAFAKSIPVPGFWDDGRDFGPCEGNALWYRRQLTVNGPVPEMVMLRIGKAEFGQTIYINGEKVRYFPYNFVASETDITAFLHPDSENELVVRVSNKEDQTRNPEGCGHQGFDGERFHYWPGIYDDVTLVVSRQPVIERLQTVPNLEAGSVLAVAYVNNGTPEEVTTDVSFSIDKLGARHKGEFPKVREGIAGGTQFAVSISPGETRRVECLLNISDFSASEDAWSPENPVLYRLSVQTSGDSFSQPFGMRTFSVDTLSKRLMLNGEPRYLLGTNILFFRFADDSLRRSLPWDPQWVNSYFKACKDIGFDSYRMCSGFGVEKWYQECDESGLMIQDEYPYWQVCSYDGRGTFCKCSEEDLLPEYKLWMRERGMHPSVVVWDLQNESFNPMFSDMASRLRCEDPQNRPFEMGWTHNEVKSDIKEAHPYMFCSNDFSLGYLNGHDRVPNTFGNTSFDLPVMINEYGYNWLNRNGDPTQLGKHSYDWNVSDGTRQDRLDYYAKSVSQMTEFWRISGTSAGIHHFCALTYSYQNSLSGFTGDILMPDVAHPQFHPCVVEAFRNAFSPLMVGIDDYIEDVHPGTSRVIDIWLLNDGSSDVAGLPVKVELRRSGCNSVRQSYSSSKPGKSEGKLFWKESLHFDVPAHGRSVQKVCVEIPKGLENENLALMASFKDPSTGEGKSSVRKWRTLDYPAGVSLGCASSASSSEGDNFWDTPLTSDRAVDGSLRTRWQSKPSESSWLSLDLGLPHIISRVRLDWAVINDEALVPVSFVLQTSDDGVSFSTVWQGDAPKSGGIQAVDLNPVRSRFVRLLALSPLAPKAIALWEMVVY